MYYFKLPGDEVEKSHSKPLEFQLLSIHTYKKIVAVPVFCCNGMGSVPLQRGLW